MARRQYYYHATDVRNLGSILCNGLRVGHDGILYLAETETDALKFMAFRGYEGIAVFKVFMGSVTGKKELDVVETFDHSEEFFKCRAYGTRSTIPAGQVQLKNIYGTMKGAFGGTDESESS